MIGISAVSVNGKTFAVMPRVTAETIGEDVRTAARSILIFKELNIFLSVLALLELSVDAVFSVRNATAFLKHGVNIFFGNSKSRGFFVLCFCYHFDLFIYGWKIDPDLILFGNAYL